LEFARFAATYASATGVKVKVVPPPGVAVTVGVLVAVPVAVGVKVGPPVEIVKLLFEMSKKMLFEQMACTRACVVGVFGTVTICAPSLGVLSASIDVKVRPPSSESNRSTLAQLTGGDAVFATFQVTFCCVFPPQVTGVFGAVI
jgi:hypothetical protein